MALRAHGWDVAVHDRTDKDLEQPLAPFRPCRSAAELARPTPRQLEQGTKWFSCELTEIEPEELPLFDYIHASLCCATYEQRPQLRAQQRLHSADQVGQDKLDLAIELGLLVL